MIDLTKLKYGIDYYALPPSTIVFITDKARNAVNESTNRIKFENGEEYDIDIEDINSKCFTFKIKNK